MTDPEFALDASIIYLNHAAVAPWPLRTVRAVTAFATENARIGSRRYNDWVQTETQVREQFRALLNARDRQEIALVKNTSEALSFVAWGLDWKAGDNVVISDQEFPSNRVVWQSLDRVGVETRIARLHEDETPEAALVACMDGCTRLLSVSSVQYGTGLQLDVGALGRACRERGILFCVDAIQSLGALRFDVQGCHADFVMADGHKWLLGPEGLGVFYCRREVMDRLTLHEYGWHMLADNGHFDSSSRTIAQSARRFECGSPNMLGVHALHASLDLLLETGMEMIEQRVLENTRFLLDGLTDRCDRYDIVTPSTPGRFAGIVTFRPRSESPESLFAHLQQHQVACALRGGGVRFSPHFHTSREQLQRALALLDQL